MEGLQPDEDVQPGIDLDLRLLQPQVRASAGELEKLLHPDFFEFGASGRTWDRSQTITCLTGELLPSAGAPITASEITGAGWPMMSCMSPTSACGTSGAPAAAPTAGAGGTRFAG